MVDPLAGRLSTTARLWLAALLCLAPMGLVWSYSVNPGTTIYGDCGYSDGPYCTPDSYLPGSSSVTLVSESPVRVFLVVAMLGLIWCAVRPRTEATRRVAQIVTAGLAVAAVLAAAQQVSRLLICLLLALLLTAPLAWGRNADKTERTLSHG